jgi:hypothetical protein
MVLNGPQIVSTGDAGDIVTGQAEFDSKVAANSACTNDGYTQSHGFK